MQMRQRDDLGDVCVIDAMTRVDGQAQAMRQLRTLAQDLNSRERPRMKIGVCIRTRVQLDPGSTEFSRRLNLRRGRIDE